MYHLHLICNNQLFNIRFFLLFGEDESITCFRGIIMVQFENFKVVLIDFNLRRGHNNLTQYVTFTVDLQSNMWDKILFFNMFALSK